LSYEATSDDIFVYEVNNQLRQIIGPQVALDISTISSLAYQISCYSPAQITGTAGNHTFFGGLPFAHYRIEKGTPDAGAANDPTAVVLKFTRTTRTITDLTETNPNASTVAVARIDTMTLQRTGPASAFVWKKVDWTESGQTALVGMDVNGSSGTGTRTDAAVVKVPGGATALSVTRNYTLLHSGEELTGQTLGSSNSLTSTFEYYDDPNQLGSYGYVKSVTLPGGRWEAFEYFDTTVESGRQVGQVKKHYRAFGNSPPGVPGAWYSNSETTTYEYETDVFGGRTRLKSFATTKAGENLAKTELINSDVLVYSYPYAAVTRSIRRDYTSATAYRESESASFRADSAQSFIRGQPAWVINPDGTQTSYVYQLGTWSGGAFTPSAGTAFSLFPTENTGTASCISQITGARNLNMASGVFNNGNLPQLIPMKTMQVSTIRDARGLVVRTMTSYYNNGWNLVSSRDFTYNHAGLLTGTTASNGATTSITYSGLLKTSETDEAGRTTTYTYDAAGRLLTSTVAASGDITALTTKFSYDAAGNVVEQRVGWGLSEQLVSTKTFDNAGRVASETPAGLGTTTHSYNVASRTHTTTRPDGSTIIEAMQLDGRPLSVTGTGTVAKFFTHGTTSSPRRYWTKVELGYSGSPRWSKTYKDMLGRDTRVDSPAFGGALTLVKESTYGDSDILPQPPNGTYGHGKVVRTAQSTLAGSSLTLNLAPTLMLYDDVGRLVRTALSVDGNNSADLGGPDRVNDILETFEQIDSALWAVKTESFYPHSDQNASTPVQTAKTATRLNVFTGDLRAETRTWDIFGNETRRKVEVVTEGSIAGKATITTTTRVGNSITEVEKSRNGLVVSSKTADNRTFTKRYDSLWRPVGQVDPRTATPVSPGATGETTTTYYAGSALVKEVKDAAGKRLTWKAYDTSGRVIYTEDALGKTTRTAYTLRGEVDKVWGTGTYPVSYAYSTYGDRTKLRTYRDPTGAANTDTTTFPSVGTADETTWEFDDASGLLKKKWDAKGAFVSYTYNPRGQLASRTWARGIVTSYTYDSNTGEQTGITYSDSTPSLTYTLDRLGRTTQITQAGTTTNIQTSFEHCVCGKVVSESLGAFFGNRVLDHVLNSASDGHKGRTIGYGLSAGSTVEQTVSYGFDSYGRLNSVGTASTFSAAAHTFNYSRVANSDLIADLTVDSGHPFKITRAYEPNRDLLTSIDATWSNVSRTKYAYAHDDLGRRQSVVQSGDVFADYGGADNGATHQIFTYNSRDELTTAASFLGATATDQTTPLSSRKHEFAYDGIGNRKSSNTSGNATLKDNYTVNELNQYVSRENNTLPVSGVVANDSAIKVAARLDGLAGRAGNFWGDNILLENFVTPYYGPLKLFAVKPGTSSVPFQRQSLTRTVLMPPATQTFTYDADGNLTADGVWTYTWDAENRLKTITPIVNNPGNGPVLNTLRFAYDYMGRRIVKEVSGASGVISERRFIYNGWNLIAELAVSSGTFSLVRTYTWGLDIARSLTSAGGVGQLVQVADHATSKAMLATYDGNGNVAALIDGATSANGTVMAAYEYSPYGEPLRCEGTYAKENPFRFSTKFTDDETGLVYYGRRYYSPKEGRFIGRDPKGEKGGIHLYAFVQNNAINRWDYLGMRGSVINAGAAISPLTGQSVSTTTVRTWVNQNDNGGRDGSDDGDGEDYDEGGDDDDGGGNGDSDFDLEDYCRRLVSSMSEMRASEGKKVDFYNRKVGVRNSFLSRSPTNTDNLLNTGKGMSKDVFEFMLDRSNFNGLNVGYNLLIGIPEAAYDLVIAAVEGNSSESVGQLADGALHGLSVITTLAGC
jgi:RHS repeat-associated protein